GLILGRPEHDLAQRDLHLSRLSRAHDHRAEGVVDLDPGPRADGLRMVGAEAERRSVVPTGQDPAALGPEADVLAHAPRGLDGAAEAEHEDEQADLACLHLGASVTRLAPGK